MSGLSNITQIRILFTIIISIIVCSLLLIAINSSLSCIDSNGCLRKICKYEWFTNEYKAVISKYSVNCPYRSDIGYMGITSNSIKILFDRDNEK